jgi:hypothetical protein
MSRSYRKPYSVHTVCQSSKKDKTIANKAVRRTCRKAFWVALKEAGDFEDFTLPHPYECTHNDIWGWDQDGRQYYVSKFDNDPHLENIIIEVDVITQVERVLDGFPAINPTKEKRYNHEEWYRSLQRK